MVDDPIYTELDFMSGGGRTTRTKAPINWLLHTEEGDSSASQLAQYCDGSHDVSYHYTLRDGILCDVVDTDYASWSVLDANGYTINLCFAGSRASWSRQQWMNRERDIIIAAFIAVQDCRKYKIPILVIPPPYKVSPGISDHRYVTKALHIGTHTDVGDGFPWDVFTAHINEFSAPASTPGVPVPSTPAVTPGIVTSAIDGSKFPVEKALEFIDYHAWRADRLATAIAQKQGINTSDDALKLIK